MWCEGKGRREKERGERRTRGEYGSKRGERSGKGNRGKGDGRTRGSASESEEKVARESEKRVWFRGVVRGSEAEMREMRERNENEGGERRKRGEKYGNGRWKKCTWGVVNGKGEKEEL